MKTIDGKRLTVLLVATGIASIALLWSWNTLAEIADAPTASFKHALAALTLAIAVRALFSPRRRHRHLGNRQGPI